MAQPAPSVFTASDCVSSTTASASEYCPQLVSLYRAMGIDPSSITFLLFELSTHVHDVFVTTYREAEEERGRLLAEIDQQTAQIPLLARELDDPSALAEVAAIPPTEGLRSRADTVKAIWARLSEVRALSGKVIAEGLKELHVLYREVGVDASAMLVERDASDFSAKKVSRIQQAIAAMQAMKADHIAQVNARAHDTLQLCDELGVTPDDFTIGLSSPSFVLADVRDPSTAHSSASFTFSSLLDCIDKRLDRLLLHKQMQQKEADRLLSAIHALWTRLDVSPSQQQHVMAATASRPLSEASIRAYGEEVARLEALKAERMGGLVEAVRRDISDLWVKLHFTHQQQLLFRPYWAQPAVMDDAFLQVHEAECERLQSVLSDWRPLLQLVEKRSEYRQQLSEMEISSSDPDRLVSRQRTAYLLLKEEEKMRNISSKWLPKLEAQLVERIERWEAEHRERWMLDGQRYLDVLKAEMDEWKANVQAKRRAQEEAKVSKTTERQSMMERKLTQGSRQPQTMHPTSADKGAAKGGVATPLRGGAGVVKRALMTPSSAGSGMAGLKKPVPLFDGRGGQFGFSGTPVKEISRTTPVKLHGRSTPKTANKENSSM